MTDEGDMLQLSELLPVQFLLPINDLKRHPSRCPGRLAAGMRQLVQLLGFTALEIPWPLPAHR